MLLSEPEIAEIAGWLEQFDHLRAAALTQARLQPGHNEREWLQARRAIELSAIEEHRKAVWRAVAARRHQR